MWNSKHNTYGLTYPLDANLGDSSPFFANSLIANGLLCGEAGAAHFFQRLFMVSSHFFQRVLGVPPHFLERILRFATFSLAMKMSV